MENEILKKIIEVETEIQERIEAEKKSSAERRDMVGHAAEEEIKKAKAGHEESLNKRLKEAEYEAEKTAEEILNEAVGRAKKIAEISEKTLAVILKRHIPKILPGGRDDT